MIRKINAFFTHKAVTAKGAKNYPTAHDLERSQLTQLFTQLLSWSLWCSLGMGDIQPRPQNSRVFFFLKISKEIGKAWRKRVLHARRACETSFFFYCYFFRPFIWLLARTWIQKKYGLFCSLAQKGELARRLLSGNENDTTVYDA